MTQARPIPSHGAEPGGPAVMTSGTDAATHSRPDGRGAAASQPGGGARLGEVARGGTQNLVGAVIAAIATVGTTLLVTREFPPGEAGAFFTATSAFMIVETLATLGANVGLVYFVARLRALGEQDRILAILRAAVVPVIVATLVLTAAMLVFADPLAHLLLRTHPGRTVTVPALTDALRGLAITIPFASQIDTVLGATRGYRNMRPTVWIYRIALPVAQLLGVAVAAVLSSVALLAPLWAVPYVPLACLAWIWLRRIHRGASRPGAVLPPVPPELAALMALATTVTPSAPARPSGNGHPPSSRITRRRQASANAGAFWRFTVPRGAAMVASILIQRLDIVLVAVMKGPVDAAVYTAATRFLVLGQFGGSAISAASQPRLTELFTIKDRRGTNVVYQATTAWLVLLTWPIYLLAMVYGPEVLAVFGHSYKAGGSVMLVLSLSMLVGAVTGQVDVVLVTAGRSSWSLMNALLVLTTNVGLDLWLIPRHGILGAAIAWAVAITVSNLVPLAQLAFVYKLHPFSRGSLTAAALTLLCFFAVPLALRIVLGQGWGSLALGVFAGSVLAVLGLARCRRLLNLQGLRGMARIEAAIRARWPGGRR